MIWKEFKHLDDNNPTIFKLLDLEKSNFVYVVKSNESSEMLIVSTFTKKDFKCVYPFLWKPEVDNEENVTYEFVPVLEEEPTYTKETLPEKVLVFVPPNKRLAWLFG